MRVLLLRLVGPMQSWGTQSRFDYRDSGLEPSKSGVIGLLAAALGRPRFVSVDDLAALQFGVRVDREGQLAVDFQTAQDVAAVPKGVATSGRTDVVSRREYLADAGFTVGFEGDDERLLAALDRALRAPHWPLSLGRKAFVPSRPIAAPTTPPLGPAIRDGSLEKVLLSYPWEARPGEAPPDFLRLELEAPMTGATTVRQDQPIGAAFETRRFAPRGVRTMFVPTAGLEIVEGLG